MVKFIETKESKAYKKRLSKFQQTINPKPSATEIAKLRQERLERRK